MQKQIRIWNMVFLGIILGTALYVILQAVIGQQTLNWLALAIAGVAILAVWVATD